MVPEVKGIPKHYGKRSEGYQHFLLFPQCFLCFQVQLYLIISGSLLKDERLMTKITDRNHLLQLLSYAWKLAVTFKYFSTSKVYLTSIFCNSVQLISGVKVASHILLISNLFL